MPGPLYPLQATFARGEISPRLFSRADVDHWKMGLALCENFFILKQGGLRRRPGTEWINYSKYPDRVTRLVPFIFSTQQAYVLEFGDEYVRFYANGGIVNQGTSVVTFNQATNYVNWTAHGLVATEPVVFSSTGGLPDSIQAGVTYYVRGTTADTFQISETPTGSALSLTGTLSGIHTAVAPVEVTTVYPEEEIWTLQFSQSADILYIAHPDYAPRELTRTSASAFSIGYHTYIDGPYLPENTTSTTMTPSGTSGSVTITASSTTGVNDGAGFDATDVGRWITLKYSSKWYGLQITAFGSATSVTADVYGLIDENGDRVTTLPGTTATGGWKLGAWCALTGWPGVLSFYQQRLVWGRTDVQPQTVWMTKAGQLDQYGMVIPSQDDDAITLSILSGEVDELKWLAEGQDLLIGTSGSMRTIGPADNGQVFSANNVIQGRQTTFGSLGIQPVQVGPVAIYSSYYGLSLREYLFSWQQNSYISPELTILSEHMLRSGVRQMTYQQDRESVIWLSMGNGELVGVTYDRDQQIVALSRQRLGGEVLNSGIVDPADPTDPDTHYAVVESAVTIPGADSDEVWLNVIRTVNGSVVRHVERLTLPFEAEQKENAIFVDASYTYSGAAVSSISGAHWLSGQTISILADGAVTPDVEVAADGSFTLPNGLTASTITFGLPYTSRVKTLPLSQSIGDGSGLGRRKTVIAAVIDFMETGYLEAGSPNANRALEVAVGLRGPSDAMDTAPPLKDGFYKVRFDRSWKDGGQVLLTTSKPLPVTVRSITPVFDTEP